MIVKETLISVKTLDGFPLVGTLFEADPYLNAETKRKPVVLIASATAVVRQVYHRFALFLAEQGLSSVTFDYRGIGQSLNNRSLSALKHCRLSDWITDVETMVDWIHVTFPERPIVYVGNSVGGHLVALLRNRNLLARVLLVATANAYWRHSRIPWQSQILFHLLPPLLCPLLGYFPSKALGIFEDLPTGVIKQWAYWGSHPDYMCVQSRLDAIMRSPFTQPVVSLAFWDDAFQGPEAGKDFLRLWLGAEHVYFFILSKEDARQMTGNVNVGHFGFFSSKPLWQWILPYLQDGKLDERLSQARFQREISTTTARSKL